MLMLKPIKLYRSTVGNLQAWLYNYPTIVKKKRTNFIYFGHYKEYRIILKINYTNFTVLN